MTPPFPYLTFVYIHRKLALKMLALDFVLGALGAFFLYAPLNDLALSINNLVLLILVIISSVLYQIHCYRVYSCGAAFYFCLPVSRFKVFPIFIINAFLPLAGAFIGYIIIEAVAIVLNFQVKSAGMPLLERGYYVLLITAILKIIPLPLFALYKKRLILVPLFFVSVALFYFMVSILTELFSGFLYIPAPAIGLLLLCCLGALCFRILATAEIH